MAACSIDVALALGLHKGMAVTEAIERELRSQDRQLSLRQKAYRFVTYSVRTERQVRDKLVKLEAVDQEIDDAVEWLRSFKLIDDVAYAERFVAASRERKPMSRSALRNALRAKGIPDALIEDALVEYDDDANIAAALRVAQRKLRMLGAAPDAVRREKLIRFLQYRGYTWNVVRHVITEVL